MADLFGATTQKTMEVANTTAIEVENSTVILTGCTIHTSFESVEQLARFNDLAQQYDQLKRDREDLNREFLRGGLTRDAVAEALNAQIVVVDRCFEAIREMI